MKIGILQTGHAPEGLLADFGDYGDMFQHLLDGNGFEFQVYSVVDDQFPDAVDAADGWLITGSRHGAYEDLPWIARLEDFLRAAYARGVPIIGVCFGHQVLAKALGGRVEKFAGGWAVGPAEYALKDGGSLTLNAWHQDQVVERPDGAEVLASSPFCENAVLAYGDKALTVQPHPEYGRDFIAGLIEKRGRGVVPDALLDDATARLDTDITRTWMVDRMVRFFKQPRV
ncbi:MAG: type 1 glutamine amidotransferase [Rhodobacteraceae bacterium]|nr:type 1 glutamine amidotransferase [Paracoccaceae bacterium]